MMNKVKYSLILVDQSEISLSDQGKSLFLNGIHILDSDEYNDYPIEEIGDSLGLATKKDLIKINIKPNLFSQWLSVKMNVDYEEGNEDILEGYSNQDIIDYLESFI